LPSAKEADRAYFARNGRPYSAKSMRAMLAQRLPGEQRAVSEQHQEARVYVALASICDSRLCCGSRLTLSSVGDLSGFSDAKIRCCANGPGEVNKK